MRLLEHRRGRPRKYNRPSRPVTVTLPEDVLDRLSSVDADLGHAIVTIAERHTSKLSPRASRPAEIATYGRHAVILVKPARALRRLPGVELVPIGSGRALISLQQPHSIPQLELAVRDALERQEITGAERQTLEAISEILRRGRSSRTVSLEERTIIVLEAKRSRGHRHRP